MRKRRGAVLVSAVLLVSMLLGGCGGKGDAVQTGAGIVASKEHVYKAETLQFGDLDINNVSSIFYFEDKLVAMGQYWEEIETSEESGTEVEAETDTETGESTEEVVQEEKIAVEAVADIAIDEDMMYEAVPTIQKFFLAVYDYEGNEISYYETEMQENEWINQSVAGKDEEALYCIVESYFEDNSDPENYIWEEHRNLVKKKLDGTEEWRISLDEAAEGESVYVNSLLCDNEGLIYVFLGNSDVLVYGADSSLVKKYELNEENMGNAMISSEGKIMITTWGEEGQYIKEFDKKTGMLSENYKVPGNSYNYSYYPGHGYDLFLTDSTALYGYNLGDEDKTEIMNFIDSDVETNNLYDVQVISDTQLYAGYYSYIEDKHCYARFTKVPPEEVADKQLLTLGCSYLDSDVRRQVVQFNKTNEKYRIQIKDYSIYNTETDYAQSFTKLNTDIVSGNIPDILVLNASLPIESYKAKGLFEDLYPYIDGDEEMDRTDFMTNIFDAFSDEGKLYQLVPSFSVLTVAGKTSEVGNGSGWTLDELNALMETKPEGTKVFFDTIRDTVMSYCIQMSSEQFINWETGECTFDSEGFVKLLEFVKPFPAEYEETQYDDEFWTESATTYRDGKTVLAISYLGQFSDFSMMEKGTYGEDITLIGFPSDNKKGSAIDYSLSFAMSSKSPNKEGVWEFLRYFLSYDYQKDSYGFPVNLQRYEELKQEAMQRPYYLDENGEKVEYDQTYYVGDVEIVIPPMTTEEIQEMENFLFALDQPIVYDENLMNIIREEAAAYFEGQKSAEEVAKIIQSRVKIYVNENR
ncbi:MAG: extracellular solute-binding protein [Lachnospiraceae bacterium]|nr:extracellular solute-binding protein [Lachnospiraceae bacterium]